MAPSKRPTMRELNEQKAAERRADMQEAIDEGRLTVRQMTPSERAEADAQQAKGAEARAARDALTASRRRAAGR